MSSKNISVSLAANRLFLDVQNEGTVRRKALFFSASALGKNHCYIIIWVDAAVVVLSLIGIGRRSENQIDRFSLDPAGLDHF